MFALTAECVNIKVPENPAEPNGRAIELFVARVPAISLNEKPDPLFLIAGGPGTSAVDLVGRRLRPRTTRAGHHPR